MCGSKEYPMRFKPGSSLSCPKDMNFLFSPVSLKALPCKQEQHKKKKYDCLKINSDYIPRGSFPTASSLSYELVISVSIICSLL